MVHQAIHTYTSGVRFGSKIGWDLTAGPVAQWITRLTTDQKIPGSNPGKVAFFFFFEPQLAREVKVKKMASEGIEPSTLALLAPRSNQLS